MPNYCSLPRRSERQSSTTQTHKQSQHVQNQSLDPAVKSEEHTNESENDLTYFIMGDSFIYKYTMDLLKT